MHSSTNLFSSRASAASLPGPQSVHDDDEDAVPSARISPRGWCNTNDHMSFGVGIELHKDHLTVTNLIIGCSADKSGSVILGDEITHIDGLMMTTTSQAKKKLLGKQGSYATVTLQRIDGELVRTFKVQLMRGAPDYIFLAEALRNLEHQNSRLISDQHEVKKDGGIDAEGMKSLLEGNVDLLAMIKTYKNKLAFAEDEILRMRSFEEEVKHINKQNESMTQKLQVCMYVCMCVCVCV
jgi:hypothetical protein